MENDKVRSFKEEFDFQVNNHLCGLEFCVNPDCYCDDDEEDQTTGYLCAVCKEPLYEGALYVRCHRW